jgi:hypothetical protein
LINGIGAPLDAPLAGTTFVRRLLLLMLVLLPLLILLCKKGVILHIALIK